MASSLNDIRKLTTALIVSGALNILGAVFVVYEYTNDRPPAVLCELKPAEFEQQSAPLAIDHSNSEVIRYFKKMPMEWLVARLNNTQLVENGYTQRDLSLASLVAFHHFDVDRSLAGLPPLEQKRLLVYGKFKDGRPAELTVYPGLTDSQCEAILNFAKLEKWPLTSQGLFLKMQKQKKSVQDQSLADAFVITPEFMALEILFNRGNVSIEKQLLIQLALEGTWATLKKFSEEQKIAQDLSNARRQQLLLNYIEQHSLLASELLLRTDWSFALEKLDDHRIIQILELLKNKSPDNERFALSLLTAPRSDAVWKIAAEKLYQYAGESVPDKLNHDKALKRFLANYQPPLAIIAPSSPTLVHNNADSFSKALPAPIKPQIITPKKLPDVPKEAKPVPKAPIKQDTLYVIQDGDTLWKVSRRYHIAVRELRSYNQLKTDVLQVGQSLKIPPGK